MGSENRRKVFVPAVGDDIIDSLAKMGATTGGMTTLPSIAAFNTLLAAAEGAGEPATPEHPMYGDISGVVYRADGTYNSDLQRYKMRPLNQVEYSEDTCSHFVGTGNSITLNNTQHDFMFDKFAVRDYDRLVIAWSQVLLLWKGPSNDWGMNFGLKFSDDVGERIVRLEASNEWQEFTVFSMKRIPAGVDPNVRVFIRGQGTTTISGNQAVNRLCCLAFPINMS